MKNIVLSAMLAIAATGCGLSPEGKMEIKEKLTYNDPKGRTETLSAGMYDGKIKVKQNGKKLVLKLEGTAARKRDRENGKIAFNIPESVPGYEGKSEMLIPGATVGQPFDIFVKLYKDSDSSSTRYYTFCGYGFYVCPAESYNDSAVMTITVNFIEPTSKAVLATFTGSDSQSSSGTVVYGRTFYRPYPYSYYGDGYYPRGRYRPGRGYPGYPGTPSRPGRPLPPPPPGRPPVVRPRPTPPAPPIGPRNPGTPSVSPRPNPGNPRSQPAPRSGGSSGGSVGSRPSPGGSSGGGRSQPAPRSGGSSGGSSSPRSQPAPRGPR